MAQTQTLGFFNAATITAPAFDGFAITPSDTQTYAQQGSEPAVMRALYVGVSGDVNLITPSGNVLLFKNVLQGTILPMASIQVKATGTTATNILGLV